MIRVNRMACSFSGVFKGARVKVLVIGALILLLTACSSRFVYNNLDWLAYWYVDDYVEFSTEQKRLFSPQVDRLLGWHRNKELPEYLGLLSRIQAAVGQSDLKPQQVNGWVDEIRAFWKALRLNGEPLFLTVAMASDEQQIDEFLKNLRDDLKKRQSKIEKNSAEKRRTRRRERLTESFSNWLSPLSADQRHQIHRLADNLQTSSEQWLEYRTRWVDELERALRSRQDSSMFKLQMERLIRDPQSLRTPEHQSHVESDQQLWVAHLIQLHRGLSEKQRTHLHKELEDLIADIRYLISQENK